MPAPIHRWSRLVSILLAGVIGAACWSHCESLRAYTPDSPEVRKMVEKGLGFLGSTTDERLGARCLMSLCFLKYYKRIERYQEAKNVPLVTKTLGELERATVEYARIDTGAGMSNYTLGVALLFLCEYDPVQYRPMIEKFVAELMKRQKREGGWGYDGELTGDTSQTQYAVLGMWMAQKVAKVEVPLEAQEACCAWLMRTQAPNGGWGYQGKDPGVMQRVDQSPITLSLSAAGCSSLYIMADLLQVTDSATGQGGEKERPGPFKAIEATVPAATKKKGPLTKSLEPATIRQYLGTGDGWFRTNYNIEASQWQHYYMYALERYESFKDLAAGRWTDEPRWYNEGVRLLQKSQGAEGFWDGQDSRAVATAFAILFLLRSTQQAIMTVEDLGSGVQTGGIGLPEDVANLQEQNGRVLEKNFQGTIDQVLGVLETGSNPEVLRMLEGAKALKLDGDVARRESQLDALRKVVSAGDPPARRLAVRTIGKVRGLANVPTLLYALTDPDVPVVQEADRALRFVSRKAEGVGLPDEPTGEDIQAARAAWKAWYLSVKPDAELLD